jgi:hypothetical protein
MGVLVGKMGEMVVAQENSIPKYTQVSENQKYYKEYIGDTKLGYFTSEEVDNIAFTTYYQGYIKIKFEVKNPTTSGAEIRIYKNGVVNIAVVPPTSAGVSTIYEYELAVDEKDTFILTQNYSAKPIIIYNWGLYYDLINKPNESIGDNL